MKLNNFQDLQALDNNSVEYKGKLSTYQTDGSESKYQNLRLTPYQDLLYKRALYGLNMYTDEEIKTMHWEKKRRILRIKEKAQASINLFKQEKVNILCNTIYEALFSKKQSPVAKLFLSNQTITTSSKFINTLDLKDLRISKRDIIDRFINEGILPRNFYDIKEKV